MGGIEQGNLAKAHERLEHDNERLTKLYNKAKAKMALLPCNHDSLFECLANFNRTASARALCKYVYYRVHHKTDTKAMGGQNNALAAVIDLIKRTAAAHPNILPVAVDGTWTLPLLELFTLAEE